jgi:hypothetical protein
MGRFDGLARNAKNHISFGPLKWRDLRRSPQMANYCYLLQLLNCNKQQLQISRLVPGLFNNSDRLEFTIHRI